MVRAIKIPEPQKQQSVNLAPIQANIERVEEMVRAIKIPEPQKQQVVDLSPIQAKVERVEKMVNAIKIPEPQKQQTVNLAPIQANIERVEEMVRAIKIPEPQKQQVVDLSPIQAKVERVEKMVNAIKIPEVPKPQVVDFSPIQSKVERLEKMVSAIKIPEPQKQETVDLEPVEQRVQVVEDLIRAWKWPKPSDPVDLTSIETRMANLEKLLKNKPAAAARPAPAKPKAKRNGPQLLKKASYGPKDDLKRISGVGPKLEKMLNKIGVYYFWQVASWNKKDVNRVDDLLDAFKGRIERDNWVYQSKSLAKLSPATPANSEREPRRARAATV